MTILLSLVAGLLVAAAVYLLLRRSVLKLAIGLGLLANAANLVIFTAGGLASGVPPLVPAGADHVDRAPSKRKTRFSARWTTTYGPS